MKFFCLIRAQYLLPRKKVTLPLSLPDPFSFVSPRRSNVPRELIAFPGDDGLLYFVGRVRSGLHRVTPPSFCNWRRRRKRRRGQFRRYDYEIFPRREDVRRFFARSLDTRTSFTFVRLFTDGRINRLTVTQLPN